MAKKDSIYTIECIYCGNIFLKELDFKKIEIIITCKKCGNNSKVTIGDINSITEVYRGSEQTNIIKSKVL